MMSSSSASITTLQVPQQPNEEVFGVASSLRDANPMTMSPSKRSEPDGKPSVEDELKEVQSDRTVLLGEQSIKEKELDLGELKIDLRFTMFAPA